DYYCQSADGRYNPFF
nr:immunoglobulin light chain junction region [Macaca mulatta]MOX28432.1 immunoglobulin light chain junction region [Macaca mulatta]MOX28870.1 immunoglobulin light chain junction region [Macaca mulatta]MOX29065.1 immunoglobulin light chain junction region [Macaca mulatta]MOX29078.1 immunoglobulin light chain junction region [Macaca mulatta]